jgi:hypothetical protein
MQLLILSIPRSAPCFSIYYTYIFLTFIAQNGELLPLSSSLTNVRVLNFDCLYFDKRTRPVANLPGSQVSEEPSLSLRNCCKKLGLSVESFSTCLGSNVVLSHLSRGNSLSDPPPLDWLRRGGKGYSIIEWKPSNTQNTPTQTPKLAHLNMNTLI